MANSVFAYLIMFSMLITSYCGYEMNSQGDVYGDEEIVISEEDKEAFRALEAKEKFQEHIPFSSKDFYNCNSDKLYCIKYAGKKRKVYQYDLDGTGKKEIDLSVDSIYYVDDNWFYYRAGKKICRVPVKKSGKRQEKLDVKNSECLVKNYEIENEESPMFFLEMDSRNLYYQDFDTLFEIDLATGKRKKRNISSQAKFMWLTGPVSYITKDALYVQEDESLYKVDRGSLKITTIFAGREKYYVDEDIDIIPLGEKVYYMTNRYTEYDQQDLMVWNGKESKCALTHDQIKEKICQYVGLEKSKEKIEIGIDNVFESNGKLYLIYELLEGDIDEDDTDLYDGVLVYTPEDKEELTINESFSTFIKYLYMQQDEFYDFDRAIGDRVYVANDNWSDCYVFDLTLGKYQKVPYEEYELLY